MSEEAAQPDSQIVSVETPTTPAPNKKTTPKKDKNPPTEKQVQARGHIKQSEMFKWSIFVRPEVKIAVQKAAKKAGITDTAWLDTALWEAATTDLSKKPKPPIKTEDVADILKQFTDSMTARQEAAQAEQAATLKAQNELIQQQGQQIATLTETVKNTQSRSIKEIIFGSSKK